MKEKQLAGSLLKFLLMIALLCSACSSVNQDHVTFAAEHRIEFYVASSGDFLPIAGTKVILVSQQNPMTTIAITNEDGRAVVSIPVLSGIDSGVLLFCAEDFFCGALRLEDDALLEFSEVSIHLAPFALY